MMAQMHSNTTGIRATAARQCRRVVALAFLAVAWLQVATAAHAFEHANAGMADVFDLCLQYERSGDTPVATSPSADAPRGPLPCAVPVLRPAPARPAPPARQRGPPAA